MDIKNKKGSLLTLAGLGITVLGWIIGAMKEQNDREEMKQEIKQEIKQEMGSKELERID